MTAEQAKSEAEHELAERKLGEEALIAWVDAPLPYQRRPAWLRYMAREVFTAIAAGVPVEGICLYPILNHPGWDDDRHCYNGMFDYADAYGRREVFVMPRDREVDVQAIESAEFSPSGSDGYCATSRAPAR